jgi:hypothetical protein
MDVNDDGYKIGDVVVSSSPPEIVGRIISTIKDEGRNMYLVEWFAKNKTIKTLKDESELFYYDSYKASIENSLDKLRASYERIVEAEDIIV